MGLDSSIICPMDDSPDLNFKNMKTSICCYIRVSTEEQGQGYSLEVQEEFLTKFAKNNNWEIGKVYSDEESGYSFNRTALRQLLVDAKLKKFDLVLVYKVDRFSRNLKDLLNLVDELESYGVALKSATEPYDTTTSAGKMMFQQLGSFAEFERNRIVERVVPGMKKSLQHGNWQGGKPPYGYVYNKEKKLLEVNPEEVKIVKLIFSMYLDNKSISYISGYLYEQGYRTRCGGKFYPTLVCDILKNKIYLGKLEWGRRTIDKAEHKKTGLYKVVKNDPAKVVLIKGRHEAFISQEDFDLVQQKLAANRKGKLHRNRNAGYPLTGILYCGECNHRFRGANLLYSRKTDQRKRYYRCCGDVEHDINCQNASFQAEYIEPQIFNIIRLMVEHSRFQQDRNKGMFKTNEYSKNDDLKKEAKQLKDKLKENLSTQTQLWKTHSKGLMSYSVYESQCIDLRKEEQDLNAALAKLDLKMLEKERSENYQALLKKVSAQFHLTKGKMDLMMMKEFLQLIFKSIVVKNKKIVKLEVYEPFETLLREMDFDVNAEIPIGKECHTYCVDSRAFG